MLSGAEFQKLIESEKNEKWIIVHYDELKKEYQNKWIAVKGQKVIAWGTNYSSLLADLKKKCGEEFCEVVLRYFSTRYRPRVLP